MVLGPRPWRHPCCGARSRRRTATLSWNERREATQPELTGARGHMRTSLAALALLGVVAACGAADIPEGASPPSPGGPDGGGSSSGDPGGPDGGTTTPPPIPRDFPL